MALLLGTLATSHIYKLFVCEYFSLFVLVTDITYNVKITHPRNFLNFTFMQESEVLFDDGEQGDDRRLEVLIVEHISVLGHIS